MGQKVHPIGFRVGIIRDWESKWYAEKNFSDLLYEDYKIRRFVRKTIPNAQISHVEIERAANRLSIKLHTGKPGIIIGRGGRGIDELREKFTKLTGKQVHVNVIEIRRADLDATLVAEYIAQQIEKRVAYKRAIRQAINRSTRAGALGVKVQVSGRLGGAEIARTETEPHGPKVPLHTIRADIDYGFVEARTTYGNIGVKVWIYNGDVLPGHKAGEAVIDTSGGARSQRRSLDDRGDYGDRRGRGGSGRRGGRPGGSRQGGPARGGAPRRGGGGPRGGGRPGGPRTGGESSGPRGGQE